MKRHRSTPVWLDLLGWFGAFAILLAYFLVSLEFLAPSHPLYHILNGGGAVGLGLEAWQKKDYQPVLLNIVWIVIALCSIFFHYS